MTNVLIGLLPRVPFWRSLAMRFTADEKIEAWRALRSVGIEGIAWQRASTLSGGQQQRVAIARALVQHARIILADEPIASLDPESARNVMEILARINQEHGITVLVSLHQVQFARRYCPRTVALRLGEVVYDGPSDALDAADAQEPLRRRRGGDARRHRDDRRRDERPRGRGGASARRGIRLTAVPPRGDPPMKTLFRAALAAVAIAAGAATAAQEINFGIISTDKSAAIKSLWDPFIDDMQKQTGLKVNAFFSTDYTGIIEAQRFNKVQVAWYGNKSAIEAVDRANGEVFAQFIDLHGTPGYYSYIITHHDSPLNSLDDMFKNGKSLNFGAGDPQSTSGTLVPGYYVFSQRGARGEGRLQGDAARLPRHQPPRGAEQAGRRRDQQQRGARQAEAEGPGQAQPR